MLAAIADFLTAVMCLASVWRGAVEHGNKLIAEKKQKRGGIPVHAIGDRGDNDKQ